MDKYIDIYNDLIVYLDADGAEDNLALSLINNAVYSISIMDMWQHMRKFASLTLDSNKQASLPSDMLDHRIVAIFPDDNGNLYPDSNIYYHYRDKETKGFDYITTGDKDTGLSTKIQFYETPPTQALRLEYQTRWGDFVGSGDEYSPFPKTLVMKYSLWDYNSREGMTNNDVASTWKAFERLLGDYKSSVQNINLSSKWSPKDDYGYDIKQLPFNLSSGLGNKRNRYYNNRTNRGY